MKVSSIYGRKSVILFEGGDVFYKFCPFRVPWFTNERKLKIPGEQLPKRAGAEKRILKKALRAVRK